MQSRAHHIIKLPLALLARLRLHRTLDLRQGGQWLFFGCAVGLIGGLAAIALAALTKLLDRFLWTGLALRGEGGDPHALLSSEPSFLGVLFATALGGLLSGLLSQYWSKEAAGAGTENIIDAFHAKLGRVRARVPWAKLVASSCTLAGGGSCGPEGPMAQIGGGLGSQLADRLHLGTKGRRMLLVAGMAAGMGAFFRAPLASAVFAVEVLYRSEDLETDALMPATIASIVAYSIFGSVYGFDPLIKGASALRFDSPIELLPYTVLALVTIGAAAMFAAMMFTSQRIFAGLPGPSWYRPMLGCGLAGAFALLLLLLLRDPAILAVLGSGYPAIDHSIPAEGVQLGLLLMVLVGFGKMLSTALTLGSGSAGGVFAPSMVIGATLGGSVGHAIHSIAPSLVPNPNAFVLVGMAGFFTAAAKTPIAMVIMVSELSGNYGLLIPSMWVAAIAMIFGRRVSLLRNQPSSRFHSAAHMGERIQNIANEFKVDDVYKKRRKLALIPEQCSLDEIVKLTAHSHQRIFPVVDADELLIGAFRIEDLSHALEQAGTRAPVHAADLVRHHGRVPTLTPNTSLAKAIGIVCVGLREEVLVVDPSQPRRVLGLLTRADVLIAYNRALAKRTQRT
ncbi:MAG: chloride channel protein [Myxococcota bacterium]|jgi:CIC family chloride channel protein|nr:chloride channel protein [Myxococcota bacterium]